MKAESEKLKGRLVHLMRAAQENETQNAASVAGLELGGARTSILAKLIAFNSSVRTLHMARKGIQDKEGQDLAKMLFNNTTLRKLELEGNSLGSMTASAFAVALRKNTTLTALDLESNNLTDDGDKCSGIQDLIKSLSTNTSLLSLNLGNNKLEADIGRMFVDCLKLNETLIDFEFAGNNFRIEDIRKIQQCL